MVAVHGRVHHRLERGIVERTHAAIDKLAANGFFAGLLARDVNFFWVKEARRRRRRPDHLPKRISRVIDHVDIGAGPVVFSPRIVRDRPRAARIEPFGYDEKTGRQRLVTKGRGRPVNFLQFSDQLLFVVQGTNQTEMKRPFWKTFRPNSRYFAVISATLMPHASA